MGRNEAEEIVKGGYNRMRKVRVVSYRTIELLWCFAALSSANHDSR